CGRGGSPFAEGIKRRIYIRGGTGIFRDHSAQCSLKGFNISTPIQFDQCPEHASVWDAWHNPQRAIIYSSCVGVALLRLAGMRQFETGRGVVMPSPIESAMHSGEQAPGEQKLWVPGDSFIE